MRPLRLFTVFHGNLDFSALPERDLPTVIARCYWPLLSLAEQAGIPIGIEMPGRTLRRIAAEDPEWLKAFRELASVGRVELVGSGLAQVVAPLAPVDVNRANLRLGLRAYEEFAGEAPRTWFVHEQTFSRGLAPLYREIGASALVMEWNNPASRRPALRALRYRPARVEAPGHEPLPVLWNDSVAFQKLQRAAHGETPVEDYLALVEGALADRDATLLCAYGGDLEIFDYRPGGSTPDEAAEGVEWSRLGETLRELARDPEIAFVLPGRAMAGLDPGPVIDLATPEQPIPCKKQPRYNPTRWAVSGRDGHGINTRCHALRRLVRATHALAPGDAVASDAEAAELVELWGSDFRTRATEERIESFQNRIGAALARSRSALDRATPPLPAGADVLLVNPWPEPWQGGTIEIPLSLPPGRLERATLRTDPPDALAPDAWQLEVEGRYRDGCVRQATLVIEPELAPGATLALSLVPIASRRAERSRAEGGAVTRLETPAVEASFLAHRGGALSLARFPAVDAQPLVGTIPHGSFDDVAYTPDFYSGHAVAVLDGGTKVTDLVRATPFAGHAGPLRVAIGFRVVTRLGEWTKLWRLYQREPRLDLVHTLRFQEVRLRSLRLGVCTWLPGAYERPELSFATVNGGADLERFALGPGARVEQHRAVSETVSASSCLGATEGWVSAGDARRGVAVLGDRSEAAVAPLLEFAEVDERFLLRVHHSAAETDETSAHFFRGTRRFAFAWLAHRDDLARVRRAAKAVGSGLVYRTESTVDVARGL